MPSKFNLLLRAALVGAALGSVLCVARANMLRTGHDGYYNPAIKRFTGVIIDVDGPDASGHVVSFKLAPLGPGMKVPEPDSMVGWRLVMLNGKRWSKTFEVKSNTGTKLTVVANDLSLDGVAAKDVFLIEEPDPNRPPDDNT